MDGPSLADFPDQYTGYRILYHLHKFTAGWRKLVVFYLAMFIAGYAQKVNTYVFWGAWAALLLMYWEPYCSPSYPWNITDDDNPSPSPETQGASSSSSPPDNSDGQLPPNEDPFNDSTVTPWAITDRPTLHHPDSRSHWQLPAPSEKEKRELRQWLHAVRQGIPRGQRLVYEFVQALIVVPAAVLLTGVVLQHNGPGDLRVTDPQTNYSSCLLWVLVLVYTLLTLLVIGLVHYLWRAKLLVEPRAGSIRWRPRDMLFFICKILGETLNTTVQALVAGSFVSFMPNTVFWLCIGITGLSYAATNLLYEMGSSPVLEEWDGWTPHCCMKSTTNREHTHTHAPHQSSLAKSATVTNDVTNLCDVTNAAVVSESPKGGHQLSEGSLVAHDKKQSTNKRPPFLVYKQPSALRGYAIIWMLMGVAAPSIALLVLITTRDEDEWFVDSSGDCNNSCKQKYTQLLYGLCSLGIMICYYAFTVGFLGAGPITWFYRRVCIPYRAKQARGNMPRQEDKCVGAECGAA